MAKMEIIVRYLGNKKFFLGDYYTISDIYAIELLDFVKLFKIKIILLS